MGFEFINMQRSSNGEPFVSIDKFGRLMLSVAARKKLNIDVAFSPWVAVSYDKETKCIALQKEELTKVAPAEAKAKVDKRGYFSAKSVVERANLALSKAPYRFVYNGEVSVKGERWLSFKLAETSADEAE